jgi:predicted transcriptional regulator
MFKIYDLSNANGDIVNGYHGIYSHAFNNSYIANIEFPDINSNISALSSVLRYPTHAVDTSSALTSTGILSSSPMIIATANDTKMFYKNQILSTL